MVFVFSRIHNLVCLFFLDVFDLFSVMRIIVNGITGTFDITWQISEKLSIKENFCIFTLKKCVHYNFRVILIRLGVFLLQSDITFIIFQMYNQSIKFFSCEKMFKYITFLWVNTKVICIILQLLVPLIGVRHCGQFLVSF